MNIPKKAARSGRSQYEIVLERIEKAIYSGVYRPGVKLPSVRELASDYGVGRKVAHSALERLARDGSLYSEPKRGFYVNPSLKPGLFYRIAYYSRGLNPMKFGLEIKEVYSLCESRGFDVIMGSDYLTPSSSLSRFISLHPSVDGLLLGGEITERFLEKEVVPLGLPYIVLGNYEISASHDQELVDVYKRTYDAVYPVFKRTVGSRMAGLMGTGEFITDRESRLAVIDAARACGMSADENAFPFSRTGGLSELMRILEEYSPDTVFFNDGMHDTFARYIKTGHSRGLFKAIACMNSVPIELRGIFDDLADIRLFTPENMRCAAERLLDRLTAR